MPRIRSRRGALLVGNEGVDTRPRVTELKSDGLTWIHTIAPTTDEAQTLAYIDTFWLIAIAVVCLVPLVFLPTRLQPGKTPVGAH